MPRLWQSKSGTTSSLELLFARFPRRRRGDGHMMAVNKPVGDKVRKGAIKKRTQRKAAALGQASLDQAR
jgi:hypothetical protein